jgi:hypothetical protein
VGWIASNTEKRRQLGLEGKKNDRCNQQQLNEISTQTQQSRLLKESARLKRLLGQVLTWNFGFSGGR